MRSVLFSAFMLITALQSTAYAQTDLELALALAKAKAKSIHVSTPAAHCPCNCPDCTCGTGEPCPCDCESCVCPKLKKAVAVPKDGQLSPRGEWRWSAKAWAWQPVAKEQPRYVTIPAQGHWERFCGRNGCVNRWVVDRPARRVLVSGTSLEAPVKRAARLQSYPSRPLGRRWTFNGGKITAAHLANPHSHHAHEHFNRQYLNSLSQRELCALGSDSHNGQVREQYVVRNR